MIEMHIISDFNLILEFPLLHECILTHTVPEIVLPQLPDALPLFEVFTFNETGHSNNTECTHSQIYILIHTQLI